MQIFASFINVLASRPAAVTVLFFYAMDHLFGNVTFECPCTLPKELRRHFALVLLICPALIILLIDIPWSLLSSIIKAQRCCCREACGGALMAVLPPLGFSIAWIFIFQESAQFSVCINATNIQNLTGCIEDSNSTEYIIRTCSVVLLCLMTAALGVRAIIQCLAPFCNYCCKSCWKSCWKSCCKSSCKCCSKPCCTSPCSSYLKSLCESCCNSCCNCLTIHPNSDLLKENLTFSTFRELDREYLLIEDEFFKGYSVEAIDKLNIGQGQQIRLKNYMKSPEDFKAPGPVKSLKSGNNGQECTQLTWKAPNDVHGQDIGYIIQYKRIKDTKQGQVNKNEEQKKSTAKLTGLLCNRRYSIHIWVIKKCCCCSKNESFCSIEICTTESEACEPRVLLPENSSESNPNKAVSKFSKIAVTHDSVSLEWELKNEDQGKCLGYKLQYKIVKNQSHVDMQQSKAEMCAEFSSLQADVLYRFKIWACNGNIKGKSSSIEIVGVGIDSTSVGGSSQSDGVGIDSTTDEGSSQSDGEPEMHKELLCDKCSQEHHLENTHSNGGHVEQGRRGAEGATGEQGATGEHAKTGEQGRTGAEGGTGKIGGSKGKVELQEDTNELQEYDTKHSIQGTIGLLSGKKSKGYSTINV